MPHLRKAQPRVLGRSARGHLPQTAANCAWKNQLQIAMDYTQNPPPQTAVDCTRKLPLQIAVDCAWRCPTTDGTELHLENPSLAVTDIPASLLQPGNLEGMPHAFSLGAAETHNFNADEEATIKRLKKQPNAAVQKEANEAFAKGNRKLAAQLYELLKPTGAHESSLLLRRRRRIFL